MTVKHYIFLLSLATIILIGCGSSNSTDKQTDLPPTEYSLMLGDLIIPVDSVTALLWFEEQLNKDIITIKIYCTSGYPITDDYVLNNNKFVRIHLQAIAESGNHNISDKGNEWINEINYEFSHASSMLGEGGKEKNFITINNIDKKNNLISFKLNAEEYLPVMDIMLKKTDRKPVIFVGKNIRFER